MPLEREKDISHGRVPRRWDCDIPAAILSYLKPADSIYVYAGFSVA
jgi:hypothetical protein